MTMLTAELYLTDALPPSAQANVVDRDLHAQANPQAMHIKWCPHTTLYIHRTVMHMQPERLQQSCCCPQMHSMPAGATSSSHEAHKATSPAARGQEPAAHLEPSGAGDDACLVRGWGLGERPARQASRVELHDRLQV